MDSAGSSEHAPMLDMLEVSYRLESGYGLGGAPRFGGGLTDSVFTGNPVNYKTARAEHSAIWLLESAVNFLGAIGLCLFIFLFYAIFLGSGSSTPIYFVYALFINVIFVTLLLLFTRFLRERRQSQHAPPT